MHPRCRLPSPSPAPQAQNALQVPASPPAPIPQFTLLLAPVRWKPAPKFKGLPRAQLRVLNNQLCCTVDQVLAIRGKSRTLDPFQSLSHLAKEKGRARMISRQGKWWHSAGPPGKNKRIIGSASATKAMPCTRSPALQRDSSRHPTHGPRVLPSYLRRHRRNIPKTGNFVMLFEKPTERNESVNTVSASRDAGRRALSFSGTGGL